MNETDKAKGYATYTDAKLYARAHYPNERVTIIHSPHSSNTQGDFFIEDDYAFVRSWEKVCYKGLGKNAK